MSGLRAFSAMAIPPSVPPVPTAQAKPSTRPPVWRQISGPVPSMCARRLATLSNWFAHIAPPGASFGLAPGRRPGPCDVPAPVGNVVELGCPNRALRRVFELSGDAARDLHVIVRIAVGDRRNFDESRAEETERVLFLLASGVRD